MADFARNPEVRKRLDQAQFVVSAGVRCDIFVVKGESFRGFNHNTSVQNIFSARDLIVDLVSISFRPKLSLNPWTKKLPRDVMRYCYQCVPYGKMSFCLLMEGDPQVDYMAFVIEKPDVKMPQFYQEMFNEAVRQRKAAMAAKR